METLLGIDIGATGIKGALVDVASGELASERIKYPTPKPATPEAMIAVARQIVVDHNWIGKPVGIGFPAIIKRGVTCSASNIDQAWIGYEAQAAFSAAFETDDVVLINDADAAGLAEMCHGYGLDRQGTVILITIGTGLGSAVFNDGTLLPNTELGHLHYKQGVYENYAANSVREEKDLKWKDWAKHLDHYLNHLNFLFSPDLILLGGGVSKKFHKYEDYLTADTEITPAKLRNNAGIAGAAMAIHKVIAPQSLARTSPFL